MTTKKKAPEGLEVEVRRLDEIIAYARNPRKNEPAVARVMASLREFGWRQPIVVDSGGVIVAGHTRYEAAKRLGFATAPVHVARGLSSEQIRAYRLVDNRTADFAEWDSDKLLEELQALEGSFGAEDLGFEIEEYDPTASEPELWDFSEVSDECVITVRGPLELQAEIRARLKGLEVTLEASHIERAV